MTRTIWSFIQRVKVLAQRRGLIGFIVAMPMGLVSFDAVADLNGKVNEYGLYQTLKKTERIQNSKNPSGYQRTGGKVKLQYQTQQIPLVKGLLFGFKFTIKGFPRDQVATELTLKVQHPLMHRPDGSQRTQYSYPVALIVRNGEINEQTGYKFDKNFEMVAGEWRFEYWNKDKKVLEQKFTTVKAEGELRTQALQAINSTPATVDAKAPAAKLETAPEKISPEMSRAQSVQPVTGTRTAPGDSSAAQTQQQGHLKIDTGLSPVPTKTNLSLPVVEKSTEKQSAKQSVKPSATQSETNPVTVSNKLSPEFKKKINDIMNKFKDKEAGVAANSEGEQAGVEAATEVPLSSHGPVTETQTRAGQQASIKSIVAPKSEIQGEDVALPNSETGDDTF